jgi:hypothetical protein
MGLEEITKSRVGQRTVQGGDCWPAVVAGQANDKNDKCFIGMLRDFVIDIYLSDVQKYYQNFEANCRISFGPTEAGGQ